MSKKSSWPIFFLLIFLTLVSSLYCDTPFTLSDNRNLTESEIARCKPIIDKIHLLIQNRDPNHGTGDNFWTPEQENSEYLKAFRLISSNENAQIIKNLILFCRFFTGFDLVYQDLSPYHTPFYLQGNSFDPLNYEKEIETISYQSILARWNYVFPIYLTQLNLFNVPINYIYQPPLFLGQLGTKTFIPSLNKEIFYNHNIQAYQERISLMYQLGVFEKLIEISKTRPVRILEIGAGYGALAQFIKTILPNAKYTVVDIPESLIYSALYLNLCHPSSNHAFATLDDEETVRSADFVYVSNTSADTITDSFDLVINTLSMSEMKGEVINWYIDLIKDQWIKDGGMFFEQNQNNKPIGWQNAEELIEKKLIRANYFHNAPASQGHANVWIAHY